MRDQHTLVALGALPDRGRHTELDGQRGVAGGLAGEPFRQGT